MSSNSAVQASFPLNMASDIRFFGVVKKNSKVFVTNAWVNKL